MNGIEGKVVMKGREDKGVMKGREGKEVKREWEGNGGGVGRSCLRDCLPRTAAQWHQADTSP